MSDKKIIHNQEYWEDLIQEFGNCKEMSIKEFCALNDVGFSTFCRWKSKLSKKETISTGNWASLHIEEDFIEDQSPIPQMVYDSSLGVDDYKDLDDRDLQPKASSMGFDLHIGESLRLNIPVGFNEVELKRLVGVLC